MPPDNLEGPACPNCHSVDTERLPFNETTGPLAVYSCGECGHVWQPDAKTADNLRSPASTDTRVPGRH